MARNVVEAKPSKTKKRKLAASKLPVPSEAQKLLGQQIRAVREARGVQQQAVAGQMGWGKDRLSRVEAGTRKLSSIDKSRLCAILSISEAQLDAMKPGSKEIAGRYLSVPVVNRHSVTKSGGKFQLTPVAKQTLCLDWLAPHVSAEKLHIIDSVREEEGEASHAEFVVVDCSTTQVNQRGVYLLWSFGGTVINRCEPDMATGKINIHQAANKASVVPVERNKVEVIGRVVGAWRRF